MKKIMLALLLLSANIEIVFAATGYRTGDDIIIWGPVILIALIWLGFQVKAKLKARKESETKTAAEPGVTENLSPTESSEL